MFSLGQLISISFAKELPLSICQILSLSEESMQVRRLHDEWLLTVKSDSYEIINNGCTTISWSTLDTCTIAGILDDDYSILLKDIIHITPAPSGQGFVSQIKSNPGSNINTFKSVGSSRDSATTSTAQHFLSACFSGELSSDDLKHIIVAQRSLTERNALLLRHVPKLELETLLCRTFDYDQQEIDSVEFNAQSHDSSLAIYHGLQELMEKSELTLQPASPSEMLIHELDISSLAISFDDEAHHSSLFSR